jgi:hypothetical protein
MEASAMGVPAVVTDASVAPWVLFEGCADSNPAASTAANGGKFFAITADSAPFYHYGPQQNYGPDKKLPKGTLLTLIRSSFGYCKVKFASGEQGYVARQDIQAARPTLVAAAMAPAATSSAAGRLRFDPSDPRFAPPPPEPLPDIEPTPILSKSNSPQ